MKLNELKINQKGIITNVEAQDNIKKRLLDIGLVSGSLIIPVLTNPGKNMVAYNIKGAIVAIRKEDTAEITVEVAE